MAQFQHHPDNWVFIRDGEQNYQARPEDFALDLGEAYEFAGRERLYEPGVRHFVDGQPQELEWPAGDGYIAALADLLAAQAARTAPEPTTRTALVQAAIGALNEAFYAAACALTAEPNLDAIKLKQWDDKYKIAQEWDAAGQPAVDENNYPDAWLEAGNRNDLYGDPNALIESWLLNGQTWNNLVRAYRTGFEPAKRAWLRATARTDEELAAVSVASLTAEIFAFVGGL